LLFITVIALAAAIFSLSVFANAFATATSDEPGSKSEEKKPKQEKSASDLSSLSEDEVKQLKEHPSIHADAPCVFGIGGPCDGGGTEGHHHKKSSSSDDKIDKINSLFRGSGHHDKSSSKTLASIPAIPAMTLEQIAL
jgi:hypothetical protein